MKWILPLVFSFFLLGCATTPKHRPIHHHKHIKHTKVTAIGDDAAIKAIIKSLRE